MKQRYGILGFGPRTGVGLLQYLQGVHIDIYDGGDLQAARKLIDAHSSNTQLITISADELSAFHPDINKLLISPGVPLNHPIVAHAKACGVQVQSEIDFSSCKLQCPVLGITGSLGKSTMAKLAFDLLGKSYNNVFLGGNYGKALIHAVALAPEVAVVEVSSFQLEASELFHPEVALFLNLHANHLDRHGSMKAYLQAKQNIFYKQTAQDDAIVNCDQPELLPEDYAANVYTFSTQGNPKADVYLQAGKAMMRGQELDLDFCHLPQEQVLALLLLAKIYGIDLCDVQSVLRGFSGLEHRQERIEKQGVVFINDSKSTTPDATLFALSQVQEATHLLLCGQSKSVAIDDFIRALAEVEHIVSITVFGEMGDELASRLTHPNLVQVDDLDQALTQVMGVVKSGDVVLFSPGFTSFDQYQSIEHRGAYFKQLVLELT